MDQLESDMTLSYSDVAEIVRIVDSSNCDEVSLELEGVRILIRRRGAGKIETAAHGAAEAPVAASTPMSAVQSRAASVSASPTSPTTPAGSSKAAAADAGKICSPMVGTFYTRPSPEEPEFVTAGTEVDVGTPLCIIEVMKLFTTIEATQAGTVRAVLAENGQMVEYGQPLFVIE